MLTKKTTFTGPGGIRLVLDPAEVFPDDPGNGTPAMVYLFQYSSTFSCAENEGELEDSRTGRMRQLTDAQLRWLNSMNPEVDKLYD